MKPIVAFINTIDLRDPKQRAITRAVFYARKYHWRPSTLSAVRRAIEDLYNGQPKTQVCEFIEALTHAKK